MDNGTEFGFLKTGEPKIRFKFDEIKKIDVGSEGLKSLVTVTSARGEHGTYFAKEVRRPEVAYEQLEKYRYFKRHGINVPRLFKPAQLSSGEVYILVNDLTQNGQYLALSPNDPETHTPSFQQLIKKISPEVKSQIMRDLVKIGMAALGRDENGTENDQVAYGIPGANALMLLINKENPDDARVLIGDFGDDIIKRRVRTTPEIEYTDFLGVGGFAARMFGEPFELPAHNPFSKFNKQIKRYYKQSLAEWQV